MGKPLSPCVDVISERQALSQALLDATTRMAQSTDPELVLRAVCDALTTSTNRIKLAWMTLGSLQGEYFTPGYVAGQAAAWGETLRIGTTADTDHPAVCQAVRLWTRVSVDLPMGTVGHQPSLLRSLLAFPVGNLDAGPRGLVCIYSDLPGYFEQVGVALFEAFIHLANASIQQTALLHNLAHLARHDMLTGMLNRRGIQENMERELSRCRRKNKSFSIILFDIDRFKLVNDRLGHREGDVVLKAVSNFARALTRQEDFLGRWGGEEFICMAPETSRGDALHLAERMRQHFRKTPITTSSGALQVTASFGVACYPEDGESVDKLVAAADSALYNAKRAGRDRTVSADQVRHDIHNLGNMLDLALQQQRVIPAYQPIVDLRTGEVVADEALARLLTPNGETVAADHFLQAANQLQLLHRVDQSILLQAFSRCVRGLKHNRQQIIHFVNISTDLLRHRDLVEEILAAARRYCASCDGLLNDVKPIVIEITEHELLADMEAARELLTPFIDFGLRLALDDFGSGYSSFRYLADLPVSFLKIDGALVRRIREPKVRAILQGIQDTAASLGITTLAEFVEDRQTETALREIGVDWAQGYLYGRPCLAPRVTLEPDDAVPSGLMPFSA